MPSIQSSLGSSSTLPTNIPLIFLPQINKNEPSLNLCKIVEDSTRQFVISFECCLDSDTIKEAFSQFLATEHNLSALQFLLACDDFSAMKSNRNRYHKAMEILDKYLGDMSSSQINISNALKTQLTEKAETLSEDAEIDDNLFEQCRMNVHLELKNDNFSRFITNRLFTEAVVQIVKGIMTKNPSLDFSKALDNYLLEIGDRRNGIGVTSDDTSDDISGTDSELELQKRQIKESFTELLEDKKSKRVTEHHFEIFRTLNSTDGIWRKIYDSDVTKTYMSQDKYISSTAQKNSNGLNLVKESCVLDSTYPDEILFTLIDRRLVNLVDPSFRHNAFVEYVDAQYDENEVLISYPVSCSMNIIKTPWPLSDREIYAGTCIRREYSSFTGKKTDVTIIRKSYHPDEKVTKGCVRASFFGAIFIQQISDTQCRVDSIAFVEFGGKIPPFLVNRLMEQRGSQAMTNLLRGLKGRRELSPEERVITSELTMRKIDTMNF